jgi:PAS domain S-box-containing protein
VQLPSYRDLRVGDLLTRLAAALPDADALLYANGPRYTFATLEHEARTIARGLMAIGVERGERVVLWATNVPEWIVLEFALAKIGAILVPAHTSLRASDIRHVLRQSEAATIITMSAFRGLDYIGALNDIGASSGSISTLRRFIHLGEETPSGFIPYARLRELAAQVDPSGLDVRSKAVSIDDVINIQFTSGTTGAPKGVMLSSRGVVNNANALGTGLGFTPADRLCLSVPLFHTFGSVVGVLGFYTQGACICPIEYFDPRRVLDTIQRERCTALYGVPTMFLAALECEDFHRYDLTSLRTGMMAGSSCPEALMRRVMSDMHLPEMTIAYGLTEASPAITQTPRDAPIERRTNTVGPALPDLEVRIIDTVSRQDVAPGGRGELCVRGYNVMRGYYNDPDATRAAIDPEGWLHTGDEGIKDDDGWFRITGRIKELIIRGGENIAPVEIENCLREHPAVADACAYSLPDAFWGEVVGASVRLESDDERAVGVTGDSLMAWCRDRLARFKVPASIRFVPEFPMTASGKIQRFRLREAHLQTMDVAQSRRQIVDTIPAQVWIAGPDGAIKFVNQQWMDYTGLSLEESRGWAWTSTSVIHPADLPGLLQIWARVLASGQPGEAEVRERRVDGEYRWHLIRAVPSHDLRGAIVEWYGTNTDIHDRKRAEEEVRRSESYLAEAQRLSRTGSFGWHVPSGALYWSKETFAIVGVGPDTTPTLELVFERVHPDDLAHVQQALADASRAGGDLELEHRLLLPDGSVKHLHVTGHGVTSDSGELEFIGAVSDISAAKLAEEQIHRSEREFRQIVNAIPQLIVALSPAGKVLYVNDSVLEFSGLSVEEVIEGSRLFHADDFDRLKDERRRGLRRGVPFEQEVRTRRRDGVYRWFTVSNKPLQDEQGRIVRWYATGTDIDDRKRAEDRIRNENVALREEISRASMFEEIIGSSEALNGVLRQVAQVAPTDSTVLITGETGTGKELVARAIHKRSPRAARAFVSVNCAAIPASLMASELFGHERGAFTGAFQRREGRFELADGGTIFLDEVGELPADTQVALLRVLQERQFERVGGGQPIRVDVRIIAATNRDLDAAVADKLFRADLFYRLNVFPVEVPALRERPADIPLLVEYFIHRFAKRAGKKLTGISKKTLDLLQAYSWPGNIRELQNVVERAVIVSDGDTLVVDERWLVKSDASRRVIRPLDVDLVAHERARVEAALAESKGRVSGPSGAAARLGIPRTTLESKIRSLKVNKHRFKADAS